MYVSRCEDIFIVQCTLYCDIVQCTLNTVYTGKNELKSHINPRYSQVIPDNIQGIARALPGYCVVYRRICLINVSRTHIIT